MSEHDATLIEVRRWTAACVRVEIVGDLPLPASAVLDAEWGRLRAANPRLHDGPVLHVEGFDTTTGVVICHRSSYKAFVAGPVVDVRVRSLGVTGVCLRGDEVLIGRRSANVRIYPEMWETAPRGGVSPPIGAKAMDFDTLSQSLSAEALEELGIAIEPRRCIAAVLDPHASSLDLVIECGVGPAIGTPNWEYAERRWVPLADARGWTLGRPPTDLAGARLSPPCAAWLAS